MKASRSDMATRREGKSVMIGAAPPIQRKDGANVRCSAIGEKPCHRPRCSKFLCERWEAQDKGIPFVEDDFQIVVLSNEELAELRKWASMQADKLPDAVVTVVRRFVDAERDALSIQARAQVDRLMAELEGRVDATFKTWKQFGEQLQQRVVDGEAREQALAAKVVSLETKAASLETRASRQGEHLNRLESWKKSL
jgi:hypothetical protein